MEKKKSIQDSPKGQKKEDLFQKRKRTVSNFQYENNIFDKMSGLDFLAHIHQI